MVKILKKECSWLNDRNMNPSLDFEIKILIICVDPNFNLLYIDEGSDSILRLPPVVLGSTNTLYHSAGARYTLCIPYDL